jgi:hypothetical protein
MQHQSQRIKNSLYDLMDSAYDAPTIHTFSRAQGHVPVIAPQPTPQPKSTHLGSA